VGHPVFAGLARELVLVHALAAIVLMGATTHHALVAIGYLRGSFRVRLGRVYATTTLVTYAIVMALGAASYPSFRVRGPAPAMFEIKEDLATLAIPAVIAVWWWSRTLDPARERRFLPGYLAMVLFTTGAVWFNVTAGLLVTMARGVS
jgi:hypothetical protein